MATRNGKKNDAISLVVLLLLLLFAGWIAWKLTTIPAAQPRPNTTRTNDAYSPISNATSPATGIPAISPASDHTPPPAVTFAAPFSTTTTTTTTATTAANATTTTTTTTTTATAQPSQTTPRSQPAQPTAQTTPADHHRPPPKNHQSGKSRHVAPVEPTRPGADYIPPPDAPSSISSTPATTTVVSPLASATDAAPKPGSQLEGFAIILAKQQDPATGRYLIAAVDGKSNLTYIYEVDAATYAEATRGLMYNPAKVATWKFVTSQ